jgi:hypothetical protein
MAALQNCDIRLKESDACWSHVRNDEKGRKWLKKIENWQRNSGKRPKMTESDESEDAFEAPKRSPASCTVAVVPP